MASLADVSRYADANRGIRARVRAEIDELLRGARSVDAAKGLLELAAPVLVERYGEIAAGGAADYY